MSKVLSAVKALIKDGDKFLIIKQIVKGQTFWDFPGGRVEYGESPSDALIREVKEETGFEIEIGKCLGVWWFFRGLDNDQVICNTFLCQIKNKMQVDLSNNHQPEEIVTEFKWITKEEFLAGDYPGSHPSFHELITSL